MLQKDTIPQFTLKVFRSKLFLNLAVGGTLFAIGLFKKIVLADGIAPLATSVFTLADAGHAVPAEAAWIGALLTRSRFILTSPAIATWRSDWRGCSASACRSISIRPTRRPALLISGAVGTSPCPASCATTSIFRLGGNRHGPVRRYLNLFATMVLGGLWHGASWNFVIWGAMHGAYLAVNHAWSAMIPRRDGSSGLARALSASLAQVITMISP